MKTFIKLLVIVFFVNYSTSIWAADYYAGNNGYWNNSSIWYFLDGLGNPTVNANSSPTVGDNVIIDGYKVTVTSDEMCSSILIKSDNRNSETYLRINSGKTLAVSNDVDVKVEDNYWVDINLLVYGAINIGGDLNFYRDNTTNNELRLYIDGGTVNITNDFNYNYLSSEASMDAQELYITHDGILNCVNTNITQSAGGKFVMELRYASEWNVSNDLIINRTNGNDFKFDMFHTSSINVQGDFSIDQNNCQDLNMIFSQSSSINTDGDFTIDWDESDGDDNHIYIELNDDSQINVDGTMEITMTDDESETHNLNLRVDSDSQINVGVNDGNFAEKLKIDLEAGAELYIDLNRDAIITVYGDAYLYSAGKSQFSLRLNADLNGSSHFDIKRDCYIESDLEDWDHFRIEMDGTSNFEVANNLEINNIASTISYTQFYLDRDAQINIGNNLSVSHNSKGSFKLYFNDDQNGSNDDAQLNIGGDFSISATQMREFEIDLKDGSDINVDGDFDVSVTGYDVSWGGLDFHQEADAGITVLGDFTVYNEGTGSDIETKFELSRNSFIVVGSNNGTYDSDFTIEHNALHDFEILMYTNSHIDVFGTLTLNKMNNGTYNYGELFLDDASNVNVYKHLILNNSNNSSRLTVQLHDDDAVLNIRGNIDMTSALDEGRVEINAEYACNLYLGGSLLRNASPNKYGTLDFSDEGTMHYNGDGTYGQQTIAENYGDGSDGVTYQYVILNNTWSTVPQFTMEGVAEIDEDRDLKFTDGIVDAPSGKYFKILNNATVSDASDNSYVDGYIHKIGNDAFTFPVGDTDPGVPNVDDDMTRYAPLTITAPSSSSTDFYCRYFQLNPNSTYGTAKAITLHHLSLHEVWLLKPVVGSPNVNVSLTWLEDRSGDVTSIPDLRVAHWDGSEWNDYGNDATSGTNYTGTIKVNSITNFSPFTLASVNDQDPLPIKLINFSAKLNQDRVDLEWITEAEMNNNYFTIERSLNGFDYEHLLDIDGAGNSNYKNIYTSIDLNPYQGISYYRLKQTDFDGHFTYSKPRKVELKSTSSKSRYLIYPNPVKNSLNIECLEYQIENIEIINAFGVIIQKYNLNSMKNVIDVSDLVPGNYFIKLFINNRIDVYSLVKI